MKKAGYVLLLAAVVATGLFAAKNDFGLGRNMEILINMMRELSTALARSSSADRRSRAPARSPPALSL